MQGFLEILLSPLKVSHEQEAIGQKIRFAGSREGTPRLLPKLLPIPPLKTQLRASDREVKMAQWEGGSQNAKQGTEWRLALGVQTENKEYFIFLDAHFMPSPLTSKCYTTGTVTLEIHSAVSYKYKHKFIT